MSTNANGEINPFRESVSSALANWYETYPLSLRVHPRYCCSSLTFPELFEWPEWSGRFGQLSDS